MYRYISYMYQVFKELKTHINTPVGGGGGGGGGGYTGFTLSVGLSVRPSVDDMVSVTQVCFEISISNFICMLFGAMGQRLIIFKYVTPKMTAGRPNWIFQFPDSNFILAFNVKSNRR